MIRDKFYTFGGEVIPAVRSAFSEAEVCPDQYQKTIDPMRRHNIGAAAINNQIPARATQAAAATPAKAPWSAGKLFFPHFLPETESPPKP